MDIFYRLTSKLLKVFFKIFYHYRVYGLENLPEGAAIIAPNHLSFLDPPLIGASCPEEVHFLARASLFDTPLFGRLLKGLHAHPVQGSTDDIQSFKLICQLLDEKKKIVIFPEGERSKDGRLSPFKAGVAMLALRTKSPIIPVYIQGSFDAWPPHRKWPKFGTPVVCVFGKPIFIEEYANLDKKEARDKITQDLRNRIEDLRIWYEQGAQGQP